MELNLDRKIKKLGTEELNINFLETGDISEIRSNHTRINTLVGNNVNGSDSNIYLRVYKNNEILNTPLLGLMSNSKFKVDENHALYKGTFENVEYLVKVLVKNNKWFYDVTLNGAGVECDLVYGQSIMINGGGSEFYNSQYIDNTVFENNGFHLCSRYTLSGEFAQIGALNKTVGYSTDGFQFFGLGYKKDNVIEILKEKSLKNQNYQYENTYLAVQSEKITLNGEENVVFYGLHKSGMNKATKECSSIDEVRKDYNSVSNTEAVESDLSRVELAIDVHNIFTGLELTEEQLTALYPEKILVEKEGNDLLSFFTPTYEHVVMPKKELLVERMHGQIVFNKQLDFEKPVLASTQYMTGVFNSHIVVGNTNINKFTSDFRNYLNTFKTSGQRFLVKINGEYRTLSLPTVFEIGLNYAKWIYQLEGDRLEVVTYTTDETPEIITTFKSVNGISYDILVLNEVTVGETERQCRVLYNEIKNGVEFTPTQDTFLASKYPHIKYTMLVDRDFELTTDKVFFKDGVNRNEPFVIFDIKAADSFKITTLGQRDEAAVVATGMDFETAKKGYFEHFTTLLNGFKLSLNSDKVDVEKYNAIAYWYTHNMLTHYSTPHGLEQYGGAAWGTRDVCQGPVEYFLATQNYGLVRNILVELFRHQYIDDGNWPQWFMFDKYTNIQHAESHGDIIVWPMRTVATYLKATGDYAILNEKISYTNKENFEYTPADETLLQHLKKEVDYIINSFIEGTNLPCYGDGDWNDSMQPANKALRSSMVSGWTSVLAYESFKMLGKEIETVDAEFSKYLSEYSEKIKADYNKYIIKDGIPAGFGLYENGEFKHIIHPSDNETKMRYRLLCINRGIISEMLTKEQADKLYDIVLNNLYREDGAILFSDSVTYRGGENTYFQRAEQSSNVGREIGLHYVHAHLRFIEALGKLGKQDKIWEAINKVTPIQIKDSVKNAMHRQANSYFSSSDANTLDRYEYMEKFESVKKGAVDVKGGWRIYSSGPGIYLNQLITNALGFGIVNKDLVIAPVLNKDFNGLSFEYKYLGKKVTINYMINSDDCEVKEVTFNGKAVTVKKEVNTYGKVVCKLPFAEFENLLLEENTLTVVM